MLCAWFYLTCRYMPDPMQWIRFFREGGSTLPWSEDWQWQTPIGTQQMVTLMVDMMRSAMLFPSAADAAAATSTSATSSGAEHYYAVADGNAGPYLLHTCSQLGQYVSVPEWPDAHPSFI